MVQGCLISQPSRESPRSEFSTVEYNTSDLRVFCIPRRSYAEIVQVFFPYLCLLTPISLLENQPTFGRLWFAHMNFWKLLELTFAWHVRIVWRNMMAVRRKPYFNGYKSPFSSLLIYPFMGSSHVKKRFSAKDNTKENIRLYEEEAWNQIP